MAGVLRALSMHAKVACAMAVRPDGHLARSAAARTHGGDHRRSTIRCASCTETSVDSMYAENGLGMAAPQIGDSRKMFIVEPKLAGLRRDRSAGVPDEPRGHRDVATRAGQRGRLPVVPRHLHQGQAADALQGPRDGPRRPDVRDRGRGADGALPAARERSPDRQAARRLRRPAQAPDDQEEAAEGEGRATSRSRGVVQRARDRQRLRARPRVRGQSRLHRRRATRHAPVSRQPDARAAARRGGRVRQIADTVDYWKVSEVVVALGTKSTYKLLEALAGAIGAKIQELYPQAAVVDRAREARAALPRRARGVWRARSHLPARSAVSRSATRRRCGSPTSITRASSTTRGSFTSSTSRSRSCGARASAPAAYSDIIDRERDRVPRGARPSATSSAPLRFGDTAEIEVVDRTARREVDHVPLPDFRVRATAALCRRGHGGRARSSISRGSSRLPSRSTSQTCSETSWNPELIPLYRPRIELSPQPR